MKKEETKDRIGGEIKEIETYLEELESALPSNFESYKNDWKIRDICERHFEKIIEAVVDLAFLLIKERNFKTPEEDKEAFDILAEEEIIPQELAKKLKDAKGMRNVIAHEYGRIDDELVYEAVTEQLEKDVREFISEIKKRLK